MMQCQWKYIWNYNKYKEMLKNAIVKFIHKYLSICMWCSINILGKKKLS